MPLPTEFDVAGATYYAVAPAGYSYSSEQDEQYFTRKYNTLAAAVAALPGTLAAPTVINILGSWAAADTDYVSIAATGSAANYLLIRCIGEARHAGVWGTSKYRLLGAGSFSGILTNADLYLRVDGLQIGRSAAGASGYGAISVSGGGSNVWVHNCILRGSNDPSSWEIGIIVVAGAVQISNTVIYNWYHPSAIASALRVSGASTVVSAYSCVAIGRWHAIERVEGTLTAKNCYAHATAAGSTAYQGTITKVACASSDASGSAGLQGIAHDADTFASVTLGTEDYHLAAYSPLIDAGTDTSGDAAPLNFTDDIDGDSRADDPWDVGIDAAVSLVQIITPPGIPSGEAFGLAEIVLAPFALPAAPPPARARVSLETRAAVSESPLTGDEQVCDWGVARWHIMLQYPPVAEASAAAWHTFFRGIRGRVGTFSFDLDTYVKHSPGPGTRVFRLLDNTQGWDIATARHYGFTLEAREVI